MTYEEAIPFWFGRVNYEQKTPHAGDFKLDRMRQLLDHLGNPHHGLRIVHIAGSKGKGSTSALLSAILQAEGYRVGLFTSPHLVDVEERIQVNRQPISRDELASLLTEIRSIVPPALERELTFFEIGTALGFLHFLRRRTDFAVVEVGLGGRFDSTNVCLPKLAIITSISLDHMQMLGSTIEKIAFEKAGIIKAGIATVSGERDPEARAVIEAICKKRGSRLIQMGTDFDYVYEPAWIEAEFGRWPQVTVTTRHRPFPPLALGLIGEHQARNAAVALAAIEELRAQGTPLSDRAVEAGLKNVIWPARLEIVSRRPIVVLDCAHNVASVKALTQALDESFSRKGRRFLIFAGSRDKDLAGMLEVLAPQFDRIYLTSFHNSQRGATPEQLMTELPQPYHDKAKTYPNSTEAWEHAKSDAQPDDLICAAGSVFLAGELRSLLG